jgi:hypothetical protein
VLKLALVQLRDPMNLMLRMGRAQLGRGQLHVQPPDRIDADAGHG